MPSNKLNIFLDLMQIMENAFIYKLKKKNPGLTDAEVSAEVEKWYMDRPGAELGDSDGVPGDIRRFER